MNIRKARLQTVFPRNGLTMWLAGEDFSTSLGWLDKSGNSGNGTNSGANAINEYVNFDAVSDVITFPHAAHFNLSGDFTITILFRTTDGGDRLYIGHGDTEDVAHGWFLKFFQGRFFFIGVDSTEWDSGISFNDGLWHALTVTRRDNSIFLFKDGAQVSTTAMTTNPVSNTDSFRLGHGGGNAAFGMPSDLGHYLMYNRALSNDEILSSHRMLKTFYA